MKTILKKASLFGGLPTLAIAALSFSALALGTRPEIPPGPKPNNEAEALAALERALGTPPQMRQSLTKFSRDPALVLRAENR